MNATKKVLVVEDDAFIALDVSQTLESMGYTVLQTLDSGEKAIASAAALSPDIILMDIGLRGKMDGIEAAHAITKSQRVPIVFLTADEDEQTLQRAKLALPYGYLIKPFNPRELRSMIEITLHRLQTYENQTSGSSSQSDSNWDDQLEAEHSVDDHGSDLTRGEGASDLHSQKERYGQLGKIPLFQTLSCAELEQFFSDSMVRRLEAGEYVVHEGSDPTGGFIVLSGRVSILKTSVEGRELIVSSLPPGSTFGLLYTLEGFSRSSSARCQIESRVLWVPTHAFAELRAQHETVAELFTEEISRYVALSHQLSSSLAHSKVEQRIISTLIALLPQFGKSGGEVNQGRIYITRRELADLVGTTPETAIRVTKVLERSDLLDLTRPGIIKILDLKRLAAGEATH